MINITIIILSMVVAAVVAIFIHNFFVYKEINERYDLCIKLRPELKNRYESCRWSELRDDKKAEVYWTLWEKEVSDKITEIDINIRGK